MQGKLEVFSPEGELLLERDLADAAAPLMILAGDRPRLVETVPQGETVLGALVRDEDGWTLASAREDTPVVSGPKSGADFHLTAGVACSLGPWVFRIEREGVATGTVLLWRVGSSGIAADPLAQGKNAVATAKDGSHAVNPAVAGEELCEVFPTADGIDVVTPGSDSQRLSVPFAAKFAVGPFQGMALPAAEAAEAVKSGNPFGWPSRKLRSGLLAMLLLVALVCLGAGALVKEKGKTDAAVAAKRGAVRVDRPLAGAAAGVSDDDVLVYRVAFYNSLPLVLQAERSPITRDLIVRGEQLSGSVVGSQAEENERDIASFIQFLRDVDAIQGAVQKGNWEKLSEILGGVDKAQFTACEADRFYEDAEEIAGFFLQALPEFLASIPNLRADGLADADRRIQEYFEEMGDNIFMSGNVVRRERAAARERWIALSDYVGARERLLGGEDSDGMELQVAWADLTDAFDPENPRFAEMVERERKLLVDTIVERAGSADSVSLIHLCATGEAVGVPEDTLAEWRTREAETRRELSDRYRELYAAYRLRAAVAPDAPDTLALLDEMLETGLEDNPFHQWALREKKRVAAKHEEEGK